MFDKLKKALADQVEVARDMKAHPGPSNLEAVPPDTGGVGGLGDVPNGVISAYVGLEVRTVGPLAALGPESSSLIGDKIRRRLREAGVGDEHLPPGELIKGQAASRLERLRAQGLNAEQIAAIEDKIGEAVATHQQSGWTVQFTNGNSASIQLFELGSPGSSFDRLQSKFAFQHTRAGAHAEQNNLAEFNVEHIDGAPYDAYYLPGILSARGRSHDADARASHLGTLQLDRTLAALAVLALHSLEG